MRALIFSQVLVFGYVANQRGALSNRPASEIEELEDKLRRLKAMRAAAEAKAAAEKEDKADNKADNTTQKS